MPGQSLSRRPITIVGGTYIERCETPRWSEVFGSGLRAACALSNRGLDIIFRTYVSPTCELNLSSAAAAYGFSTSTSEIAVPFEFRYLHSLKNPYCIGPSSPPEPMPVIETDLILSYGMLEGNAVVRANRAVYDPQSPSSPVSFRANGSESKELAIIANEGEALRLSHASELRKAGEQLREAENAQVVVIKRGLRGALIFTEGEISSVPAYRTRSSFLIGSGDVFSSEFAYRWLIEGASPEAAANFASLAVAYYSQNPVLPVPVVIPESFTPTPINLDETKSRKVYLAGPFFNLQQHWMIDETLKQLTAQGLKLFSPLHDVGYGDPTMVATEDLAGILACDSLFALVDGYDPGTLFEIGYARAKEKPVTAYVTSKESTHLTMLLGSGCDVFHDFVSAVSWEASR